MSWPITAGWPIRCAASPMRRPTRSSKPELGNENRFGIQRHLAIRRERRSWRRDANDDDREAGPIRPCRARRGNAADNSEV